MKAFVSIPAETVVTTGLADVTNAVPDEALAFEHDQFYYQEGDEEWDREEFVTKRRALRKSMKVATAAIRFWQLLGTTSPTDTASFRSYKLLHGRITAVLAPEMTAEEMAAAAEDDWADDAGEGAFEITLQQFSKGIFGIADLWTDSCNERDYVDFLTKLFLRVSVRSASTGRRSLSQSTRGMEDEARVDLSVLATLSREQVSADGTTHESGTPAERSKSAAAGSSGLPSVADDGTVLGTDGRPLRGPNGDPLSIPPCSLGPEGTLLGRDGELLDASGRPVLGADGLPIRIPPCSIRADGVILDPSGEPMLGVNGEALRAASIFTSSHAPAGVRMGMQPLAGGAPSLGRDADGELLDASGRPVLGADGLPIRIPPCSIRADGVILDPDGLPVVGTDGQPVAVRSTQGSIGLVVAPPPEKDILELALERDLAGLIARSPLRRPGSGVAGSSVGGAPVMMSLGSPFGSPGAAFPSKLADKFGTGGRTGLAKFGRASKVAPGQSQPLGVFEGATARILGACGLAGGEDDDEWVPQSAQAAAAALNAASKESNGKEEEAHAKVAIRLEEGGADSWESGASSSEEEEDEDDGIDQGDGVIAKHIEEISTAVRRSPPIATSAAHRQPPALSPVRASLSPAVGPAPPLPNPTLGASPKPKRLLSQPPMGMARLSELRKELRVVRAMRGHVEPPNETFSSGSVIREQVEEDGRGSSQVGSPGSDGREVKQTEGESRSDSSFALGKGGAVLASDGRPLVGPDGEPLTVPPCLIGADGSLLSADGQPLLGADGLPLRAPAAQDSSGATPIEPRHQASDQETSGHATELSELLASIGVRQPRQLRLPSGAALPSRPRSAVRREATWAREHQEAWSRPTPKPVLPNDDGSASRPSSARAPTPKSHATQAAESPPEWRGASMIDAQKRFFLSPRGRPLRRCAARHGRLLTPDHAFYGGGGTIGAASLLILRTDQASRSRPDSSSSRLYPPSSATSVVRNPFRPRASPHPPPPSPLRRLRAELTSPRSRPRRNL